MIRSAAALAARVLIAFILSLPLYAESLTVLKAQALVDVEKGKLLQQPLVFVRGNRIEAVGVAGKMPIPTDAEVIDLGDATLLPGLLDAHVHLTNRHSDHGYRGLAHSVPRRALFGAANARKTLMAGFTTVRNVGAEGYADIALRDAIKDGDIPGPRILAAGPAIGITGGHCDSNLLPSEFHHIAEGVADGPWGVRTKVRENAKYGADLIKFCGTGGVLSKGTQVGARQYTFEEMQALVDEAHTRGLKVAVHAHGADGIKTAIRAGVDSVEHASFIDAEGIKLAKKHGTYLSMDIYVSDFILAEGEAAGILPESLDKERQVGRVQRENFAKAVKAGVKMALGTDAGVYPHGDNGKQLAYLVKHGMSPMQALQTATINTASLFGMQAQVGAVSEGRLADIIAVQGNPLEDMQLMEQVTFVMKDGKIYKGLP